MDTAPLSNDYAIVADALKRACRAGAYDLHEAHAVYSSAVAVESTEVVRAGGASGKPIPQATATHWATLDAALRKGNRAGAYDLAEAARIASAAGAVKAAIDKALAAPSAPAEKSTA